MSDFDQTSPLVRTALLNGDALDADGTGGAPALGGRLVQPAGTIAFGGPITTLALNPVIDDIQPRSAAPGTPVAILGRNFNPFEGEVRFNGILAPYTPAGTTRIDTVVPNGATTGRVTVDGFQSAFDFVVLPAGTAPRIQGFTPAGGRPGDVVSITGANLDRVTDVRFFNNVRADFFPFSPGLVQATVPAGATSGPLTASGPTGSATSANAFVVGTGTPAITSFSPTAAAPGVQVDIRGTELGGATRVTFNGVDAPFTVISNTQVLATVPGFVGNGPIRVHTPLGTAVSASSFFAGSGLPAIDSVAPNPARVNDVVTLDGRDLDRATGVRIGAFRIQVISRPSNQRITFTLPGGATTGEVILESAAGEVRGPVLTILPPPTTTVTSITPQGAPGFSMNIFGTGLSRVTGVFFAPGIPAQFGIQSDTQIIAFPPEGAITGPIRLDTPAGPVFTPPFVIIPRDDQPPVVTVFAPAAGAQLTPGQVAEVRWDARDDGTLVSQEIRYSASGGGSPVVLAAGVQGSTRSQLVQIPAQPTDNAVIIVAARDSTGKIGEGRSGVFRVGTVPPQVLGISPAEGPLAGGTSVTVTGRGFQPGARVRIGGNEAPAAFVDATRLSAVTPPGAVAGAVQVAVVNPDGARGVLEGAFRYLAPAGVPVSGRLVLRSVTVTDPEPDPAPGVPGEPAYEPDGTELTAAPAVLVDGGSIQPVVAGDAFPAVELPVEPLTIAPAEPPEGDGLIPSISRPLGLGGLEGGVILGGGPGIPRPLGGVQLVAADPAPASILPAAEPPAIPRIRAGETMVFDFIAELFDMQNNAVRGVEVRIESSAPPPESTLTVDPVFVPSFGQFFATLATTPQTPPGTYTLAFQGFTVLQPTLATPVFTAVVTVDEPLRRFAVFVAPERQAVTAGGTATYDITLKRKNLKGVRVTPKVTSPLPAGVTVTFDPPKIEDRDGKMIVQTAADTAPGEVRLRVTGTVKVMGAEVVPGRAFLEIKAPSAPATTRIDVGQATVTDPEPELGPIEPAATAEILAVPAGGTVAFPIIPFLFDAAGNAIDDEVQFTLDGVPPGAVGTIIPNPGRTFRPSVASVVTTRATPVGRYTLRIRGDSLRFPGLVYGPAQVVVEVRPRIRRVELAATPVEVKLAPGQTAEYQVALRRTGLNNKVVQLEVDPATLPPSATATFDPAAPTGDAAVLRIATTAATPAGTYTVALRGRVPDVQGAEVKGTTVRLVVEAAPVARTVRLSVSPTAATLQPGGTARFAVRLARANATGVSVALKATGNLPAGTVFAFTPMRTTTSSAVLNVTLPLTARAGAYTFQVTGTTATAGVTIAPSEPVAVRIGV